MAKNMLLRQHGGLPLITRLTMIAIGIENIIGNELALSVYWTFSIYHAPEENSMAENSVLLITPGARYKSNLLPTTVIYVDKDGELCVGENVPLTLGLCDRLTRATVFGESAVFRIGHLLYAVLSPRKLPAKSDAPAAVIPG